MNDPLASGREGGGDFVVVIRWLAPPASNVSALRAGVMQAERRKPSGSWRRVTWFQQQTEEPGRLRGSIKMRRSRPLVRLG